MRVLFSSTRGTGHFTPLVPFIEGCIRGGHEVIVAGPPPLADAVARAGHAFWEGASPPEDELGAVWGRVPTVSPEEGNAIVIGEIFGGLNVRAMLPRLEQACAEWRPDVVIREQAEFAASLAAERHGLPHARVGVTLANMERRGMELAAPRLEELEPGVAERIWASPYLTYLPAALEDPDSARPPATHRFRYPASQRAARGARPLVYVSFGTEAVAMPIASALYAAVFDAAAELPADVLLALGQRDADPAALGPVPANVRVEPWVNPAEVLPRADAAVSHGGFGTTMGAIASGLPLVVVPLFGDQPDNARRVEAAGAGVVVWPDPDRPAEAIRSGIDPNALRDAITTALDEPGYRRVAGELAAEMAAQPPTDEALAAVMDARR
jgi:UDP:flavonoid glycosyltransferase YjiC (YdhE family)